MSLIRMGLVSLILTNATLSSALPPPPEPLPRQPVPGEVVVQAKQATGFHRVAKNDEPYAPVTACLYQAIPNQLGPSTMGVSLQSNFYAGIESQIASIPIADLPLRNGYLIKDGYDRGSKLGSTLSYSNGLLVYTLTTSAGGPRETETLTLAVSADLKTITSGSWTDVVNAGPLGPISHTVVEQLDCKF